MKRCSLLLSICTALCLSIAGCGAEKDDSEAPPAEPPVEQGSPDTDTSQQQPPGEQEPGEGQVQAQGKSCTATCTVQNYGTGTCPATVVGYGRTTFLGGCNKACNKAIEDAYSKALPAGCVIYQCGTDGC